MLEAFFDEHPNGDLSDFDSWAATIPELAQDPELRSQYRATLQEWLGSTRRELQESYQEQAKFEPLARRLRDLRPGDKVGPYLLRRSIASGGFGEVWEAEDPSLGIEVALKLVLPERLDEVSLVRFAIEARAGARSRHPNLVTTLAYGTDDGLSWIAQELIPGSRTLRTELIERQTSVVPPAAHYRWVAEQVALVADGMQAAHDRGVIHRDLKPQNILLDERNQPKVTDFGLARIEDEEFRSKTEGSSGTPQYMSPEQLTMRPKRGAKGGRVLDARTDVYSLGVVMYELLTLRLPFVGDWVSLLDQILHEDPVPADRVRPGCPRDLVLICGKALEKSPERRYETMEAFAADVRRHLAHEPILARPAGLLLRTSKWIRRHPAISLAGAVASFALLVVSLLAVNLAATAGENAKLAVAALENEAIATQRANDVLSLSAIKDLEDLIAEAQSMWPPHPEMLPRYERWLAEAQALRSGSLADEALREKARPSLMQHEAKLHELTRRAMPQRDEGRLRRAQSEGSYAELERERANQEWRLRMSGLAEWPDLAEVEAGLDWAEYPSELMGLLEVTNEMVGPNAVDMGRVYLGWVLAGRALDRADDAMFPKAVMVVSWAEARLGRFEAALDAASLALEEGQALVENASLSAHLEQTDHALMLEALEWEAKSLEQFVASWRGKAESEVESEMADLSARILQLEIDVGERFFRESEDAWWHRQLRSLVRGIQALHDPMSGLAGRAVNPAFGWGVAKRAEFASEIEERSVAGPDALERWKRAIDAIKVSEHYGGLVVPPQLGLLPLGPDEDSGLWEFAHLMTGEPPSRDDEGGLVLRPDSGLVLVLVPGGTYTVGSQSRDPQGLHFDEAAAPDEEPVHQVDLEPFFISKFEMTQGQWSAVSGMNPSYFTHRTSRRFRASTALHPVEHISWEEATNVMKWCGLILPTERQWEISARGRTETPWWTGTSSEGLKGRANFCDKSALQAGAPWFEDIDWGDFDDGYVLHCRVGTFEANAFGLHEVAGNVWEWCSDTYLSRAYDPTLASVQKRVRNAGKVYRGGAFNVTTSHARSANRAAGPPSYAADALGLRPARRLEL